VASSEQQTSWRLVTLQTTEQLQLQQQALLLV
jgi:hypothetical protein